MQKFATKVGINVYVAEAGEKITPEQIEEDFAYVLCGKGMFVKRKNFLYEGLFKVDNVPDILGEVDSDITEQTELKIPQALFHSIERFFKRIYDKLQTEVECFLYYNIETQKWAYCVPQQKVTGSHVDYDEKNGATYILEDNLAEGLDALPDEEGWVKIGSIHSHASMGAFHSGTDDKDEFGFDGIHITIGNLNSQRYSYACRVMYGKVAVKKELDEVVDFPTPPGAYPEALEERVSKDTYTAKTYAPVKTSGYGPGSGYPGYDWRRYGCYGWDEDYDGYPTLSEEKGKSSTTKSIGGFADLEDIPARGRKGSKRNGKRTTRYQYGDGVVIMQEEK